MLREMPAAKFEELARYEQMESPETRMDLRFSILAQILAVAHNVTFKGQTYRAGHFLEQIDAFLEEHDHIVLGDRPVKRIEPPKQKVETMVLHLDAWMNAANTIYKEKRRIEGRRR